MLDYLNKEKKRNEFNTDVDMYNCGGYALRTYSWYLPWEDEYEILDEINDEQLDEEDALECILQKCCDYMLNEFDGTLRIAPQLPLKKFKYNPKEEELIAFRVNVNHFEKNDEINYFDIEFHFKVYRDGKWMEKLGSEPISYCENENQWDYREQDEWCDLWYDSPTLYLLHRISDNV